MNVKETKNQLDYFIVKKNKILFVTFGLMLFLVVMFYSLIGVEQYNYIYPHIDTEFAADFDAADFDKIKTGMTKVEVEKIIGKPLSINKNEFGYMDDYINKNTQYIAHYSSDGNYKFGDFAWENFEIYYDIDFIITSKRRVWLND